MKQPLINILIRVSRAGTYKQCINSVECQTYGNIRTHLYWDLNRIGMHTDHGYNLFCNDLKHRVDSGYLFFMDDDDSLINPNIIEEMVTHLQDEPDGLVVQFLRNGKPKPSNALITSKTIRKGMIGGGCLVLHSKHKDIADWEAIPAADYKWIKEVSEKVQLKFVPLVVQVAGNNGLHGKQTSDLATYERGGE